MTVHVRHSKLCQLQISIASRTDSLLHYWLKPHVCSAGELYHLPFMFACFMMHQSQRQVSHASLPEVALKDSTQNWKC